MLYIYLFNLRYAMFEFLALIYLCAYSLDFLFNGIRKFSRANVLYSIVLAERSSENSQKSPRGPTPMINTGTI